jgi:hypothetical protein
MELAITGDTAPDIGITAEPIVLDVAVLANVVEVLVASTTVQVLSGGVTVVQVPGERGPAGAGGGLTPTMQLDLAGSRFWYLLYVDHISRIDNAASPSVAQRANSTDWAGRSGLTYI